MDVSKYNTTDAANIARKLSLKDPFTKEILLDDAGATVDIFVYGMVSDVSRNAQAARDRKYGKVSILDDNRASQAGAEFLASITKGWSDNLEGADGSIAFTSENAIKLYLAQDWIAGQVLEFSRNLANYDPKLWGGSASGSAALPGSTPSQTSKLSAVEKP